MKMKSIRLVFVALVCLVPPPARADDATDLKKDVKVLRVPFDTIMSQHMVVQVKVNGKGPYRMIFDTGAPFTLLLLLFAMARSGFPSPLKSPTATEDGCPPPANGI